MSLKVLCLTYLSFALTAEIKSSCSDYQLKCEADNCISLNNNCASLDGEYEEECTIWTSEVRWLKCENNECEDVICDDIKTCDKVKPKLINTTHSKINPCVVPTSGSHMSFTPPWPPGQKYDYLFLEYTCYPGYKMTGDKYRFCTNNTWCGNTPSCVLLETTTSKYISTTMTPNTSPSACRDSELQCNNGKCINSSSICDGIVDCEDPNDETGCALKPGNLQDCKLPPYPRYGSYTRRADANNSVPVLPGDVYDSITLLVTCDIGYDTQIKEIVCVNGMWFNEMPNCDEISNNSVGRNNKINYCSSTQWQCDDGGCIDYAVKCNGVEDCTDRSDELHCDVNERRLDDACVVPDQPPVGVYTFIPNSSSGSEVDHVTVSLLCPEGYKADKESVTCLNGVWKENYPMCIELVSLLNCSEGQWKCANWQCINSAGVCDGLYDCNDHTDESEELCTNETSVDLCEVPYVENGNVSAKNHPASKTGQAFQQLYLEVTCSPGYMLFGLKNSICFNGTWMIAVPQCIRYCVLKEHPAIKYNCRLSGGNMTGTRPCREAEPVGTVVEPKCQDHYYSEYLADMTCTEAGWNHSPICKLDCGTLTPGQVLSIGSRNASRSEVPWHVGIYRKKTLKINRSLMHDQICGGSLISYHVLISAAHCFHNNAGQKLSENHFSVAVGKLYRLWDDPLEYPGDAQKSEIKKILMPDTYHSESTYYQSDIAVVEVTKPFQYQDHVKPVCLDLDDEFDERQLNSGALGKVAGWGYLNEEGVSSPILKIVEEPIYNHTYCYNMVQVQSRPLITSDKICGGYTDGSRALCKGDSGGGLTVNETRQAIERYYLRGVVSSSTNNDKQCNRFSLTYFTRVVHHRSIILKLWSPI